MLVYNEEKSKLYLLIRKTYIRFVLMNTIATHIDRLLDAEKDLINAIEFDELNAKETHELLSVHGLEEYETLESALDFVYRNLNIY